MSATAPSTPCFVQVSLPLLVLDDIQSPECPLRANARHNNLATTQETQHIDEYQCQYQYPCQVTPNTSNGLQVSCPSAPSETTVLARNHHAPACAPLNMDFLDLWMEHANQHHPVNHQPPIRRRDDTPSSLGHTYTRARTQRTRETQQTELH